jgi:hypothetical protein
MKLLLHKIFHWEYWPFQIVYIPIYFLWGYYALRAKSLFFFNAANPSIKNGGFFMESKKMIYNLIPQQHYPKTKLLKQGTSIDEVKEVIAKEEIQYPFIAKPDIGLRGSAVKKISCHEELNAYVQKADFDYIIQDLIPYENEVGIFYVRYPNEDKGRITGVVAKEFLIVVGDGCSTIATLIKRNPRFELQLQALQKEYGDQLQKVLNIGEKLNLVPYGNHARGAKFIDGSHWITPELEKTIDAICVKIPGFFYGRLDVMYRSWEELEKGENFAIVELNGAASEPTHIYDPKHSVFFAWKELARHITYLFEISMLNNQQGFPFLSHKEGLKQYQLHREQSNKIVNF